METIHEKIKTVGENPLIDFHPNNTRNDNQILEEYLSKSPAYHELTRRLISAQTFDEVNQHIAQFNRSDDARLIGDKFRRFREEYMKNHEYQREKLEQKVSFTQMIYIEKSDRRSVQRIDISFNYRSGGVKITNGMNSDGTFKSMWDDIDAEG